MLVVMTCTMLVTAPIMMVGGVVMALREDVGLSWLMLVSVPVLGLAVGAAHPPDGAAVPAHADPHRRGQPGAARADHRHPGGPCLRPRAASRPGGSRVANDELTDTALRVGRLMALIFPIVMLVLNVSSVAVLWFGAQRVDAGQMQVGSLTAFLTYLMQILMAVMMATFMLMMIPRAAVCAERITEVLRTDSSVVPPASPVTEVTAHGEVELRDVRFQLPGRRRAGAAPASPSRPAPGRTTAVIGATGSGKTTLISLIPRLFDATGGSVLVDGVDVREIDPELLWRRIGLVPQRPYLFTGTIASNLRYGNPDATDEELWDGAGDRPGPGLRRGDARAGWRRTIAQGGTNVSGGQRQRLAIARALVRKPEIYLFDDSFSALDLATDARLRAALRPDTADAAVIIVAQRVSTILDADQILVLDDGGIVGRGTPRRAAGELPDVRRDRRLPAHRRGQRHEQRRTRPSRRPPVTGQGRARRAAPSRPPAGTAPARPWACRRRSR